MIYVCSDIHGQYGMFKKMLKKINFSCNDELYIIGDVVDRGPQPVSALLYIMEHDNMHMMIGNHEDMMIRSQTDRMAISTWFLNGAETTDDQLAIVGDIVKKRIMDWLMEQPLIIPDLHVGSRQFYLAHATHAICPINGTLLYKDAGRQMIQHVTWSREYKNPDGRSLNFIHQRLYEAYKGATLLCGHTPTYNCSYGHRNSKHAGRISRSCHGHLINLDCGCASERSLGFLCLNTMQEYYVDGKNGR